MRLFSAILITALLVLTCSCAVREVYVSQYEVINTELNDDTPKDESSDAPSEDSKSEITADANDEIDVSESDGVIEETSAPTGVINGQTYENTALGIGCTLDEDWRFLTPEELAEKNTVLDTDPFPMHTDAQTDNVPSDTVKHTYVMCAMYKDELSNVTLSLEYIGAGAALIDISQLLKVSAEAMKPSFEGLGYTDFQYEADTVNIGTKIFHAIRIFSRNGRVGIDQLMFCFIKNGHLVSVCVSDYGAGIIDQTEKCFFLTEE